jgi:hypothetical protein
VAAKDLPRARFVCESTTLLYPGAKKGLYPFGLSEKCPVIQLAFPGIRE